MKKEEKIARFIERRADAMEQRKQVAMATLLRAVASDVRAGLHEDEQGGDGDDDTRI